MSGKAGRALRFFGFQPEASELGWINLYLMELKRCTKCVTPETHETITFDEKGVCNICHGHEIKQGQIDWASKKLELDELVETYRGKK